MVDGDGMEAARCQRIAITAISLVPSTAIMSIRGPRKGENYELSVDLNSEYREKRKDAIKRVIASMTVGKGLRCDGIRLEYA